LLMRLLKEAGIALTDVAFANVFRKQPPKDDKKKQMNPSPSQITRCFPHTLEMIVKHMPNLKAIITLGALPLRVMTSKTKITKYRGVSRQLCPEVLPKYLRDVFVDILVKNTEFVWGADNKAKAVAEFRTRSITIIPTFHPAYILRSRSEDQRVLMLKDFGKAKDHTTHIEVPSEKKSQFDTETDIITDFTEALNRLRWLRRYAKEFGMLVADIETDHLNFALGKQILCIGFSYEEGKSWVFPTNHKEFKWSNSDLSKLLPEFKGVLKEAPIVGANFAFDWCFLADHLSIEDINLTFDITYAHSYLYTGTKPNDLETLTQLYTDMPDHKAIIQQYFWEHPEADPEKGGSYAELPLKLLCEYCGADVDATLRIAKILKHKLQKMNAYMAFQQNQMSPVPGIVEMRLNGMHVNESVLLQIEEKLSREFAEEMDKFHTHPLVVKFYKKHKNIKQININTPWQTAEVIYKWGKIAKKNGGETEAGAPSTKKEALVRIRAWVEKNRSKDDPVISAINLLEGLRTKDRILKTYVTPIKKWLRRDTVSKRDYSIFCKDSLSTTVHPRHRIGKIIFI